MNENSVEQYFHVVVLIMLYKVVLTFTEMLVDETPVCDHSVHIDYYMLRA